MKIIPIHRRFSKEVASYSQIKSDVDGLKDLVEQVFNGRKSFALHHCQVSEYPFNFFVVAPDLVEAKAFKHQVIINPKIAKNTTGLNFEKKRMKEGCMSFVHRDYKMISRYTAITVQYQVPTMIGLKTHTELVYGIPAQIFQHEIDHSKGVNIYDDR